MFPVTRAQASIGQALKVPARTFAWAKATEGTTITDGDFTINESHGKAAGVYMGGYDFAHPESNSGGTDENHFWAVAGPYIKADSKTLMPMLDMEVFSGHVGASSYSDWANQFNNALVSDAAATGVKIKPFIYNERLQGVRISLTASLSWGSAQDVANYNGESSSDRAIRGMFAPVARFGGSVVWSAWQYSDRRLGLGNLPAAWMWDVYNAL